MSIPRIAIEHPVTMFIISGVIILLGGISLTKLPVDLPTRECPPSRCASTTRGSARSQMEELSHAPHRAGGQRRRRPRARRLDVVRGQRQRPPQLRLGTDLSEAADEVRTRVDRVRGRMPEDADAPTVFKSTRPPCRIMGIGVEGEVDPVTLRELAQNDLSPRLERAVGVAAVTINGGLRRQSASTCRARRSRPSTSHPIASSRFCVLRIKISRLARSTMPTVPLLRSPGQFADRR